MTRTLNNGPDLATSEILIVAGPVARILRPLAERMANPVSHVEVHEASGLVHGPVMRRLRRNGRETLGRGHDDRAVVVDPNFRGGEAGGRRARDPTAVGRGSLADL